MVVKLQVQLAQKLKRYTFVLCWYKWNYMRAVIKGGGGGWNVKQLIDLESPNTNIFFLLDTIDRKQTVDIV